MLIHSMNMRLCRGLWALLVEALGSGERRVLYRVCARSSHVKTPAHYCICGAFAREFASGCVRRASHAARPRAAHGPDVQKHTSAGCALRCTNSWYSKLVQQHKAGPLQLAQAPPPPRTPSPLSPLPPETPSWTEKLPVPAPARYRLVCGLAPQATQHASTAPPGWRI